MPAHRLLAPRDFRRMPWKNGAGRTSEIASWPDGAGADAFAGRVSIAEIERDEREVSRRLFAGHPAPYAGL